MLQVSKYLIYGLQDPDTKQIRYIGKSSDGLERPREHRKPSLLVEDTHKNHWIKKLLSQGKMYETKIIEELTDPSLLSEREIYWIADYKSKGAKLTNGTEGGEGAIGRPVKEETRKIQSEKRKQFYQNNPHVAKVMGEKQRKPRITEDGIEKKHCSDCDKYVSISEYGKDKNSWDALRSICKYCAKIRTEQYRIKNPPKKLSQGELKEVYKNRSAKSGLSIKKRFAEDPSYRQKLSKARSKPVLRTNPLTGEIKEYQSALAAKAEGFNNTEISACCKYGGTHKGFYWKFKE